MYVGDVLYAVCYVCICSGYGVVVWCCGVSWCYVYVDYGNVLKVFCGEVMSWDGWWGHRMDVCVMGICWESRDMYVVFGQECRE